jgi:putative spermidine/putrescine transport system permease protein
MRCFSEGRRDGCDEPPAPGRDRVSRARRFKLQIFRITIFLVLGAFFLVPIGAMFEFSTRGIGVTAARTLDAWTAIIKVPDLVQAITASLQLAAITSIAMLVLLLPTMVWVRLRLPALSRIIEFICLLPLTVPAIALVVGMVPIYRWMKINVSDSILMLSFAYLVLVLPYTYRTLDAGLAAIDLKTLTEAARSLGAGWGTVMLRVVVPNMSTAILNACLLSVALVLGEFTFANLLLYENMQVAILYLFFVSAGTSIAVAVASLLFAFVLLMVLSFVGRPRQRVNPEAETMALYAIEMGKK